MSNHILLREDSSATHQLSRAPNQTAVDHQLYLLLKDIIDLGKLRKKYHNLLRAQFFHLVENVMKTHIE